MQYGYSKKTNGFYLMESKASYENYSNWPDDIRGVSNEVWLKYSQQAPNGKIRGVGDDEELCWVDIPVQTKNQSIESAEIKKEQLLSQAKNVISPLQDAVDLDMASIVEKNKLIEWKRYRVLLNRIDIRSAPDIIWPDAPE